jgi:hypothetical protein
MLLNLWLLLLITAAAGIFTSCTNTTPDLKIFNYPSDNGNPVQNPVPGQVLPTIPAASVPKEETFERNIVVTQQNSYFPIGLWAGYTEKTDITAEQPVDIAFGDMPENIQLEINGRIVPRSYRWETRIGTMKAVTSVSYRVTNNTTRDYSYALYIIPSPGNQQVKVTVRQRFIPKP